MVFRNQTSAPGPREPRERPITVVNISATLGVLVLGSSLLKISGNKPTLAKANISREDAEKTAIKVVAIPKAPIPKAMPEMMGIPAASNASIVPLVIAAVSLQGNNQAVAVSTST